MARKVIAAAVLLAILGVLALGVVPQANAQGQQTSHVVRRGETLSSIAWQYKTTVKAIQNANGIKNPNLIYAGQRLIIPAAGANSGSGGSSGTPSGNGWWYVVERGDTLASIAYRHGTTYQAIQSANNLGRSTSIIPGQRLWIPGYGSSSSGTSGGSSGGSSSGGAVVYVVKRGDTLYKIASKYHTTVQAILNANPSIRNASLIYVGQRLTIPGRGQSAGQANQQTCQIPPGLSPRTTLDVNPGFAAVCTGVNLDASTLAGPVGSVIDTSFWGTKYYTVPGCATYGVNTTSYGGTILVFCFRAYP